MDRALAEKLVMTCIAYGAELNKLLFEVRASCPKNEFEAIRRGVGQVMGNAYVDIMRPIFGQHPDLEPEGWKSKKPRGKPE